MKYQNYHAGRQAFHRNQAHMMAKLFFDFLRKEDWESFMIFLDAGLESGELDYGTWEIGRRLLEEHQARKANADGG